MCAWDVSVPAGSDPISQGDDAIRAMKVDLQTALRGSEADGTVSKFPGADTANPVYHYRGRKGATVSRPAATDEGLYFDTTRNVLQRSTGAAWEDVGTVIPAGTVAPFFQAAAPVGWTQVVTQNDKALRVVSGAGGGTGGTHALSSPPSTSHNHTASDHAQHYHNLAVETDDASGTGAGIGNMDGETVLRAGTAVGSLIHYRKYYTETQAAFSHTINANGPTAFAPQYIDVILCSKD